MTRLACIDIGTVTARLAVADVESGRVVRLAKHSEICNLGQDVDATRSMGFTLLDLDQLRRLQELARQYFTCWYRDPYGGRSLCAVSWNFSSGVPYDWLKVSASMTETVFEEAW